MRTFMKIAGVFFCCLLGLIILFVLNYGIIQSIIIPDPCAYHNRDSTKIFNLFYKMKIWDEGYHPFPNKFNYALTTIFGVFLYKRFTRRKTSDLQPNPQLTN